MSTGPALTKPKRRMSKATSPSSPRGSFHYPPLDHTHSTSSNSSPKPSFSQPDVFYSSSNNNPPVPGSTKFGREREYSIGTSSATNASSPVVASTFSYPGGSGGGVEYPTRLGNGVEVSVNGGGGGGGGGGSGLPPSLNLQSTHMNNKPDRLYSSSHHTHHPHPHTHTHNGPIFPGLNEECESSSGRSSFNDSPVVGVGGQQAQSQGMGIGRVVGYGGDAGMGGKGFYMDASGSGGGVGGLKLGEGRVEGEGGPQLKILGIDVKWISLLTLALQNALLTIIMHYSRISVKPSQTYSAASAVLVNEVMKGSISSVIALKRLDNRLSKEESHLRSPVARSRTGSGSVDSFGGSSAGSSAGGMGGDEGEVKKFLRVLGKRDRWNKLGKEIFSPDCWKLSIPAILYVIQNNLQYSAASNLDVATFQVTYQMKILTTAFFSVVLLGKRLSTGKWLALLLLAIGVGIVQIQSGSAGHVAKGAAKGVVEAVVNAVDTAGEALAEAEILAADVGHEMHPLRGFLAVSAACLTSGLAGVYFEMVLKGSKADLWVRNAQLSLFSLIPALLPVLFNSAGRASGGFFAVIFGSFRNFSLWAWATVLTQVLGGLITALVIKYSDNILKGFATSLSIILSFMASVVLFNYHVTPAFVMGSSIVLSATWMYNQPANNKPNPIVNGLAKKVAEATGGKVDPTSTKSRTAVAVPGSPISTSAPIIGEPARPSRTSSLVSLLGLGNPSSRGNTPKINQDASFANNISRPGSPYLTPHGTPAISAFPSSQSLSSLTSGVKPHPPPLNRTSSAKSVSSHSDTPPLRPLSMTGGQLPPRDRGGGGPRSASSRPILEVNTGFSKAN